MVALATSVQVPTAEALRVIRCNTLSDAEALAFEFRRWGCEPRITLVQGLSVIVRCDELQQAWDRMTRGHFIRRPVA